MASTTSPAFQLSGATPSFHHLHTKTAKIYMPPKPQYAGVGRRSSTTRPQNTGASIKAANPIRARYILRRADHFHIISSIGNSMIRAMVAKVAILTLRSHLLYLNLSCVWLLARSLGGILVKTHIYNSSSVSPQITTSSIDKSAMDISSYDRFATAHIVAES